METGLNSIQWQIFNVLLLAGAGGLDVGIVFVNRLILTTGVYKFPYPITTTFLQLLITFLVILAAQSLIRFFFRIFKSKRLARLIDSDEKEPLYLTDDTAPTSSDRVNFSTKHDDSSSNGTPRFTRRAIKEVAPLAIVFLLKLGLDNIILTHTQHPTYLLLRVEVIPLSLILSALINRVSPSILTIWSTFLACSSLLLAIYPSVHQITFENVFLGTISSIVTALFPVLLLKTFNSLCNWLELQHPVNEFDAESAKLTHPILNKAGLRVFWSVLRLLAMIPIPIVFPILLLSGELSDIHRNCYVLDLNCFWLLMAASGLMTGVLLISTLWLVRVKSPVMTTFLLVPSSGFQVAILNRFSLPLYSWVDTFMCWGSSLYFYFNKGKESVSKAMSSKQKFSCVLYNMGFPVILYMGVLYFTRLSQAGTENMGTGLKNGGATYDAQELGWYNNTKNSFKPKDDYLGTRPHVDMVANLTMMEEKCGEIRGGKGVDDVVNCLSYLTNFEQEYLSLPVSSKNMRASEQDPRHAQFLDADRHGNTRSSYIPPSRAQAASRLFIGTCAGPIIPFHVYWTGSASWRVELFIKAYLYTQNLPCSRLWLWLDSDIAPESVDNMLSKDPIFERFRPLVERGDIVLKAWKFPDRVPIPTENADHEDLKSEKHISKGVVQDANGQRWLDFDPSRIALSPVVVSDAVRFIVLHLYGGLYCDMDVLLLRDMRPMILPDPASDQRAFAEQWVERSNPGDYNTAVISLPANSSLSTYLLSGGLRMGLNFHPRVIGRMLWRDGRNGELKRLHNAVFDPLVTNLRREGTNTCTVPCHKNFQSAFMRQVEEAPNEWSNFRQGNLSVPTTGSVRDDWAHPTNRSMENFFRGSWAYHIHNQWWKFPEPLSWMDVITRAQDGFFTNQRTNAYGEKWSGPNIAKFGFGG